MDVLMRFVADHPHASFWVLLMGAFVGLLLVWQAVIWLLDLSAWLVWQTGRPIRRWRGRREGDRLTREILRQITPVRRTHGGDIR